MNTSYCVVPLFKMFQKYGLAKQSFENVFWTNIWKASLSHATPEYFPDKEN